MKALIFCAVIFVTCTQLAKAFPENESAVPDESVLDNEINSGNDEIKNEVVQEIQAFNAEDNEEQQQQDQNEDSYVEAIEEEEDEDDDDVMDIDTMEKTFGIDIPICAEYSELKYPLHVSHLSDCGKFYKCSNGRAYLFDCPAGEHFSIKYDRCDYPEIARCSLTGEYQYKLKKVPAVQANDGSEVATDDDEIDQNEESDIDSRCDSNDPSKPQHFAHPKDCSKFYKCYMGKAYVVKCPKGQHWGQRLNRCEHPTLARCTAVKSGKVSAKAAQLAVSYMDIPEKHSITSDADYIINDQRCLTEVADRFHPTHFAHPSDCQMFYTCFNKRGYKVSCPLGLHYNDKTKACDYPEVANCESVVGIQKAQHNVEMSKIPDCSHGRTMTMGIQGSIKRYFQCQSGEAYLRECADGEFFNVNVMRCDHLPQENHVRLPQWPSFQSYLPNYQNNYFQPMRWNMNQQYQQPYGNYNSNWQYPMYQQQQQAQQPEAPAVEKHPESLEFPSWMPQLNNNMAFPQLPVRIMKPVVSESE